MKKRLKKVGLTGILALTLIGMTGCGKVTEESLLKSMYEKMENIQSYEMEMTMDLVMKLESSDFNMDMKMNMDMDTEANMDPQAAHMDGDITVEFLGQKQEMKLESYAIQEGDKMLSYANTKVGEQESGWIKTEETQAVDVTKLTELMKEIQAEGMEKMAANMKLAEKTQEVNGSECYVLAGTETGDMVQPAVDALKENMEKSMSSQQMEIFNMLDWSKMEIPVEIYIDKKTKYPVKMNLDMGSSLDGIMGGFIQKVLEKSQGTQDIDFNLKFDTCTMEMSFSKFDEVEAITVPEEVKNSAAEANTSGLEEELGSLLGNETEKTS